MNFDLIPIMAVACYLLFAIVWMWQFNKRIEPWLRARIGHMLGVKIAYRGGIRRSSWMAVGVHSPGTGCLIAFWEFIVTFVIGGGMVFLALLILGLIMFAIYG